MADKVNVGAQNLEMQHLFKQWRKKEIKTINAITINHSDRFIEDGAVCPDRWNKSSTKILFLLKEAYDITSLTKCLSEEEKHYSRLWRNVAEWTYGLLHTNSEFIPRYIEVSKDKDVHDLLSQIAIVNVKKSSGSSKSKMKEINVYAEYDKEELKKQIEMLEPDIIVCGYTIKALNIIFGADIKDYAHPCDNWYYTWNIAGKQVLIIDYYHPANHYPKLANYYAVTNIYQQALKNGYGVKRAR